MLRVEKVVMAGYKPLYACHCYAGLICAPNQSDFREGLRSLSDRKMTEDEAREARNASAMEYTHSGHGKPGFYKHMLSLNNFWLDSELIT